MNQNRGKPWDDVEESTLLSELSMHQPMEKIAIQHGRSVKAIQMRVGSLLKKHQHLSMTELTRKFNLPETMIHELLQLTPTDPEHHKHHHIASQFQTILERLDSIDRKVTKLYKHQYRSSSVNQGC